MFRRNEGGESRYFTPVCTGPITLPGSDAAHGDIANVKAALPEGQSREVLMPAASPGTIAGASAVASSIAWDKLQSLTEGQSWPRRNCGRLSGDDPARPQGESGLSDECVAQVLRAVIGNHQRLSITMKEGNELL